MHETEDCTWVFDSLIGFLQGPIWSAPLLTFIEEKSLIFEADTEDSEDYQRIYQEYKNLVDLLLGCFMEDMGITPEQFEHACNINKDTKMPVQFQQSLFEQIWAANEYDIFKRMMIQKNLELQLQALNMIEQKYGLTPASLIYETDGLQDDELVVEEMVHKHILEEDLERDSSVAFEKSLLNEHKRLVSEYHNERTLLDEALKVSTQESGASSPSEEPTKHVSKTVPKEVNTAQRPAPVKPPVPPRKAEVEQKEAREEDIKQRQEYLKARRDKLVALKKEARSQQLEMNKTRPGSARVVAEAAINGKRELDTSQIVEPSILQVRKALAARLKAEVVRK